MVTMSSDALHRASITLSAQLFRTAVVCSSCHSFMTTEEQPHIRPRVYSGTVKSWLDPLSDLVHELERQCTSARLHIFLCYLLNLLHVFRFILVVITTLDIYVAREPQYFTWTSILTFTNIQRTVAFPVSSSRPSDMSAFCDSFRVMQSSERTAMSVYWTKLNMVKDLPGNQWRGRTREMKSGSNQKSHSYEFTLLVNQK
jgi:hypothetical protein